MARASSNGKDDLFTADLVVHAAGRVPDLEPLDLPAAGVASEKQARDQGIKFRMRSEKASDWYTARRIAETAYGFKVLVEEGTERILGAHLIGPHVDEVINIFALAIRKGLTAEDLKTTMFAYPTGASDIGYMV